MTEPNLCQMPACSRPVHDGWYVCAECGRVATDEILDELPWLFDDLELVITRQTRYVSQAPGSPAEAPLIFNLKASDTRAHLVSAIDTTARVIADENGWRRDHDNTPASAARWVRNRISAVRLHPAGGELLDELGRWFAAAVTVCDRPQAKQYLGDCVDRGGPDGCPGKIYGRGKPEARCDTCGSEWDADALRAHLLRWLEDRLLSASEISHLSTYLGLIADREQVRKRINQWHRRGQVQAHRVSDSEARFRFGEVYLMLARDDNEKRTA